MKKLLLSIISFCFIAAHAKLDENTRKKIHSLDKELWTLAQAVPDLAKYPHSPENTKIIDQLEREHFEKINSVCLQLAKIDPQFRVRDCESARAFYHNSTKFWRVMDHMFSSPRSSS
jgi:hypothetical protein